MANQESAPDTTTAQPAVELRKRRYSRGAKDVQKLERGVTKAARRVSQAVTKGLDRYIDLRDRSSRKKRDGAIRDGLENVTRAMGKVVREASKAPADIVRSIRVGRLVRRASPTLGKIARAVVPL